MTPENIPSSDPNLLALEKIKRDSIDSFIKKGITDMDEMSRQFSQMKMAVSAEEIEALAHTMRFDTKVEEPDVEVKAQPENTPKNSLTQAFLGGTHKAKAENGLPADNPVDDRGVLQALNQLGGTNNKGSVAVSAEEAVAIPLKQRKGVREAAVVVGGEKSTRPMRRDKKENWSELDTKISTLAKQIRPIARGAKKTGRVLTPEERKQIAQITLEIKTLKGESTTSTKSERINPVPTTDESTKSSAKERRPQVKLVGGKWVNVKTGEVVSVLGQKPQAANAKATETPEKTAKDAEMFSIRGETTKLQNKHRKGEMSETDYKKKLHELQNKLNKLKEGPDIVPVNKASTTTKNPGGQATAATATIKNENAELKFKPVLTDEDITQLKKAGYTDPQLRIQSGRVRASLNEMRFEDLQTEEARLGSEIKKIKDKDENAFSGEKAYVKTLVRNRANIKREMSLRKKEVEAALTTNQDVAVPSSAFEDDYSPKSQTKDELEKAVLQSERDAFINSVPESAFEDPQTGKAPRSFEPTNEEGSKNEQTEEMTRTRLGIRKHLLGEPWSEKTSEETDKIIDAYDANEDRLSGNGRGRARDSSLEKNDAIAAFAALGQVSAAAEKTRAEKIKSKALEFGRFLEKKASEAGEWYNGKTLPTKLAYSAALLTASLTLAASSAPACGIIAGAALCKALRIGVGFAGSYVALQMILNKSRNEGLTKKGRKNISEGRKNENILTRNPKVSAAILAALMVGTSATVGALIMESLDKTGSTTETPAARKNTLDFAVKNYPIPFGETETPSPTDTVEIKIPVAETLSDLTPTTPAHEMPQGSSLHPYTVEKNDNLYKIIRENFSDIKSLPAGAQANAIENILAEIKLNPEEYGIISNDVNKLAIGDKIDLEKIKEILENKVVKGDSIIDRANIVSNGGNLPPLNSDVVHHIEVHPESQVTEASKITTSLNVAETIEDSDTTADASHEVESEASTPTSPEEKSAPQISPTEITQLAENLVNKNLDMMFGKSGFLGLFEIAGKNSLAWKEFAPMSASSIIGTSLEEVRAEPADFQKSFSALHQHLQLLAEKTGIIPTSNESAEVYLAKATAETIKQGITL